VSWDAIEPPAADDGGEASVDGLAADDGAVVGAAVGDGLLPPDVQALTMSASSVAPRAALRIARMGPPSVLVRRRFGQAARDVRGL
jgi:hypothetical protein